MSGRGLILAICVTMIAFAGNSLLNRLAVDGGFAGALEFAGLRVLSGALVLGLLVALRPARRASSGQSAIELRARRIGQALWLTLYLFGFSLAYISLDAGLGALILFGGVQVTMFAAALWQGEAVPGRRWLGMAVSVSGLVVLVAPAEGTAEGTGLDALGVLAMLCAALGWGLYSVLGRKAQDPLLETAVRFALAAPVCVAGVLLALWLAPGGPGWQVTSEGLVLAIFAGGVTSGLGYALWYAVLPRIPASSAARVQLSAPFLAVLGGVVLLGEDLSLRMRLAGALILGGIAFGLFQRRIGSSGS